MDKSKVMMIAIIVLLLLLLGTIVGVSVYALNLVNNADKGGVAGGSTPAGVVALSQDKIKTFDLADPIITNLVTDSGETGHMIRANFGVGVNFTDEKAGQSQYDILTEKEVIIRDLANSILRSKTYNEMNRSDAPDIVKEELLSALQEEFQSNLIVKVYVSYWYVY